MRERQLHKRLNGDAKPYVCNVAKHTVRICATGLEIPRCGMGKESLARELEGGYVTLNIYR
jgi:hypothetical protein